MPIRDSYNNRNSNRRSAEKNGAKKSVDVETSNGATNGNHVSNDTAAKTDKDEALENGDAEETEVFDDVDDPDNGVDETVDDEENSISLEEVESARRDILDPKKHQKLRKGFRMASICWDDWSVKTWSSSVRGPLLHSTEMWTVFERRNHLVVAQHRLPKSSVICNSDKILMQIFVVS